MLNDLIGFIKVSTAAALTKSDSGSFVTDMAGISQELSLGVINSDGASLDALVDFWDKVRRIGYMEMRTDFQNMLAERATLNANLYQSERISKKDEASVFTTDNKLNGVNIRVPQSNYSEIFIRSIQLFAKAGNLEGGEITIEDLPTRKILDTYPLPASTEDELIVIKVNKGYSNDGICIRLMGSDLSFYILDNNYPYDCDCDTYYIDTYGKPILWPDLVVKCSASAILEANADLFVNAAMNKLSCQIMKEKVNAMTSGKKFNYFTTGNLARAEELVKEFQTVYEKCMRQAIKAMPLQDDVCFPCGEDYSVNVVTSLP